MKTIFYIFITIILAICLIYFSTSLVDNEVIAATGSSTSDVQLIGTPLPYMEEGLLKDFTYYE